MGLEETTCVAIILRSDPFALLGDVKWAQA